MSLSKEVFLVIGFISCVFTMDAATATSEEVRNMLAMLNESSGELVLGGEYVEELEATQLEHVDSRSIGEGGVLAHFYKKSTTNTNK